MRRPYVGVAVRKELTQQCVVDTVLKHLSWRPHTGDALCKELRRQHDFGIRSTPVLPQ